MIDYGKTRSTVKPEPIVIDEHSVWVHTNVEPIEETNSETKFVGFVYDMVQYKKDEYIKLIDQKNNEMESLINTILGVTENE